MCIDNSDIIRSALSRSAGHSPLPQSDVRLELELELELEGGGGSVESWAGERHDKS